MNIDSIIYIMYVIYMYSMCDVYINTACLQYNICMLYVYIYI